MAYSCVGIQRVDFVGNDNKPVKGNMLYLLKPVDPRFGQGLCFLQKKGSTCSLFVSDQEILKYGIKVGSNYDFSFDENGRPLKDTIKEVK